MFSKCNALPKGDLFDMRHVCFRIPFLPCLLWNLSVHSLPEAWGPWEGQYAPPILQYACIMPIPSLQLQKKAPVSCREAKRLVTQLWCPRCFEILWLCSQLCYETAANQRTLVEFELLATVGWKWGCQPFSCLCLKNMTHSRKENYATYLSKESIPAITFGNLLGIPSIHSLPEASGFWEPQYYCPQYVPPALRYSWIISSPSLQQKKTCLTQRSKGFGHGVVVSNMCYSVSIQWLCSQLCYVTAANQWTILEIELLATVGWKCGCQPFSCRCKQNVANCRKETCSTCLFKESIPVIPFGSLQHAVPTRSLTFLRAEVPALHFGCIMQKSGIAFPKAIGLSW